jgi:hypothetical protein
LKKTLAVAYNELAARGSLLRPLPNPGQYVNNHITEHVNDTQPEILNIGDTNRPYKENYRPSDNPQSIPSQNGAVNNDREQAAMMELNYLLPDPGQYANNHITEYVNGTQPELFNISGTSRPYEDNYLPFSDPQSIPSENSAVYNDHEKGVMMDEESNYLPACLLGQHSMSSDMSSLTVTTNQQQIEMDVINLGQFVKKDLR